MYNKIQAVLVLVMVMIMGTIVVFYTGKKEETMIDYDGYTEIEVENEFQSGWLPYWDYNNAKLDWISAESQGNEIISFGVLYDESELYVPEETDKMTRELVQMNVPGVDVYLSFVNDVYKDGQFSQKDVGFLWSFLPDALSREEYIDDIIRVASEYGVDGIEIDFENIKTDTDLWGYFSQFVSEMYEKCIEKELELRVVLSYDSAKYTDFPQGPQYVVMCYNLYGLHSGPGPKADKDFLEQTFEINEVLKPNVTMAFSNNGFAWEGDGTVEAVTKSEAISIAKLFNASVVRDQHSNALSYVYQDGQGGLTEVWFADDETIAQWKEWAVEAGYQQHALWRYGQ